MKKQLIFMGILALVLFLTGCVSDAEPIVYDKSAATVKERTIAITMMINSDNLADADEALADMMKTNPNNTELETLNLYLLIKQNKIEQAEARAEILLKKDKKNPLLYTLVAMIYKTYGDYEHAMANIKISLSLSSMLGLTWFEKGIIEYMQADYKNAELSFNRAYLLDRSYKEAYFFRYLTKIYLKRPLDEIKHQWYDFIKDIPLKPYFYTYHAEALFNNGYTADALKVINEGLATYPSEPYLLNFAAYLHILDYQKAPDQELLTTANTQIQKALSQMLLPEFVDTELQLYLASKDYEHLRSEYEKYVLIFPSSELIRNWKVKLDEVNQSNEVPDK